jgi:hypothetical protein
VGRGKGRREGKGKGREKRKGKVGRGKGNERNKKKIISLTLYIAQFFARINGPFKSFFASISNNYRK